ncbi:MAG: transcriptional regulator [Deltaproteobacteria bacterium]|nr:transcriptional regulator [Deltaproteobacteria bacterium]
METGERDKTIRQMIIELLQTGMLTAKDISKAISVKEKDVIGHLPHVVRSAGRSRRLIVEPSVCLKCGFVFNKRDRLKTPSKCPVCKAEEITETRYGLV